jgi:transcriptional regulator with XRE-family HTH domain
MATRRVGIGPTGKTVQTNLAKIRNRQGLVLRDLAEKVTELGWPMAHNTISEIERGARRCDVDDLVFLAAALQVSPTELLGITDPATTALLRELIQFAQDRGVTDGDN